MRQSSRIPVPVVAVFAVAIGLAAVFCAAVWLAVPARKLPDAPAETEALEVNWENFLNGYKGDAPAADSKYLGRRVELYLEVHWVRSDGSGNFVAGVVRQGGAAEAADPTIRLLLRPAAVGGVTASNRHGFVTVNGLCRGASRAGDCLVIALDDCRIVDPGKRVFWRDDFDRRVRFRSYNAVIDLVGRPSNTQKLGNSEYWYYYRRTRDEVTGNLDQQAQVVFENGLATHVNY
jgi:hypothetical protein